MESLSGEELVVIDSRQQELKNVHRPGRESLPVYFNDYGFGCTLIAWLWEILTLNYPAKPNAETSPVETGRWRIWFDHDILE